MRCPDLAAELPVRRAELLAPTFGRLHYRQKRAAIFDSDLCHETAALDFRDGYENRRINVTMLFGARGG